MIVAKTRMKKIPESCNKCKLSYVDLHGRFCRVNASMCPMERSEHKNLKYIRPDWCPLIEMKHIAEPDKRR